MHKKIILPLVPMLLTLMIFVLNCHAALIDADESTYVYGSLPINFYIGTSSSGPWATVFENNSNAVDIASDNVGEKMGTFASGASISPDTYTHVRVIISNVVTLKSARLAPDGNWYGTDSSVPYTQTRNFGTTRPDESALTTVTFNPSDVRMPATNENVLAISGGLVVNSGDTVGLSIIFSSTDLCGVQQVTIPDGSGGETTTYVLFPGGGGEPTITQVNP